MDHTDIAPNGIEAAVCADIAARQRLGVAKYGTTVADNPLPLRDWLQHAYEESLDLPIYLKRAIVAMDKGHTIAPFNHGDAYRGTQCSCGFTASTGDPDIDRRDCEHHLSSLRNDAP